MELARTGYPPWLGFGDGLFVYTFGVVASARMAWALGLCFWTRSFLLYILLRSHRALMVGVPLCRFVELRDNLDTHIRTICVQIYPNMRYIHFKPASPFTCSVNPAVRQPVIVDFAEEPHLKSCDCATHGLSPSLR